MFTVEGGPVDANSANIAIPEPAKQAENLSLISFIEAAASAKNMHELWDVYQACMARYGFTRVVYGFTVNRTDTSFGDPQDLVVLSNHTEDYMEGFLKSGMFLSAPMLRWARSNIGAQSWQMLTEMAKTGDMTEEERKVFAFNRAHGIVAGYTISLPYSSSREKGAVGLAAAPGIEQPEVDRLWAKYGRTILALTNVAHLKLLNLPHANSRRPLTKRQREVLEWVGDGKTTADIATIMGLTPATVEKHLRLARESLDVDTTAQAVLKASFQNQIYVLTP